MPIVIVEAVAPMSSWRPPEATTFHPTFLLPPYTAQIGTLAAALGLPLTDGYRYVADHQLRLGVGGWHNGSARDLWKFQKLKDAEVISDVILREHWIETRLVFVIESPEIETAAAITEAFISPAYPLTAGVSDALLHPVRVRIDERAREVECRQFRHVMLHQEIGADYQVDQDVMLATPLMQTIRAPSVELLPTGFVFDDTGKRQLAGRSLATLVADPIELAEHDAPIPAYPINVESSFLRADIKKWNTDSWAIPVQRYD